MLDGLTDIAREVHDDFVERLAAYEKTVRVGDPMQPTTDMGTLIGDAQLARVEGFVERAREAGARIIVGGYRAEVAGLPGCWIVTAGRCDRSPRSASGVAAA